MFYGGVTLKQKDKSLASKNKILDAAKLLFSEKGYEETTMQNIMVESGLSKGAIYHYFTCKQEILSSMIKDAQEEVNLHLAEIADNDSLSVEEKVQRIISFFIQNQNQNMLIVNRWVEKVPYALIDTIRNGNKHIAPQIAKIIKQGIQEGKFQCDYPDELAEVLLLLFDVWLDPVIIERTPMENIKRLKVILHLLENLGVPLLQTGDISTIINTFEKGVYHE